MRILSEPMLTLESREVFVRGARLASVLVFVGVGIAGCEPPRRDVSYIDDGLGAAPTPDVDPDGGSSGESCERDPCRLECLDLGVATSWTELVDVSCGEGDGGSDPCPHDDVVALGVTPSARFASGGRAVQTLRRSENTTLTFIVENALNHHFLGLADADWRAGLRQPEDAPAPSFEVKLEGDGDEVVVAVYRDGLQLDIADTVSIGDLVRFERGEDGGVAVRTARLAECYAFDSPLFVFEGDPEDTLYPTVRFWAEFPPNPLSTRSFVRP